MFDDIRPYSDSEVKGVLDKLINDPELLESIQLFRFAAWPSWCGFFLQALIRRHLARQIVDVRTVHDFQMIVKGYVDHMVEETTSGFTVSGIENIPRDQACLFLGNHRDITLDPAFTNLALHRHGFSTVRIAIGDNLLSKPFVSQLMRLNKSFIVKRSASGPREILKTFKELSTYIRHSLQLDGEHVWMAQREGRAKDGFDRTEPAIIKMLAMSLDKKTEEFATHINSLNIIPVSISYEFDPCDLAKSQELAAIEDEGGYDKTEHEDIRSIAMGIAGFKGKVHLSIGSPLVGNYTSPEAVAAEVDRQIYANYRLFPSNYAAWEALHGELPAMRCAVDNTPFDPLAHRAEMAAFMQRLENYPPALRPRIQAMYAQPLSNQLLRPS